MPATERLYYLDSHLTEFEARVLDIQQLDGGRTAVKLDRTAFYPTGGGQPSDTGMLDSAPVIECIDQEEDGVLHVMGDKNSLHIGDKITGRVDWPRRLDHIQQHTGQHILSAAFVALYGAETRGFRLLERSGEIDLAFHENNATMEERLERAVDFANRIIWENRPVRIRQVSAEEARTLPLRKDSEREGELRLIEIKDFDLSPCGGTHAQATGEVGMIAVRSWERAKGMTRIVFVAGTRALTDYRTVNASARKTASLLSVGRDEAPEAVARLIEENKNLLKRLRPLEELAANVEAETLIQNAHHRSSDNAALVIHLVPERDAEYLKRLAQSLIAHQSVIALLASTSPDQSARFVFARSADLKDEMNVRLKEACTALDGRGGGSSSMAQGGGRAVENKVRAVLHEIAAQVLAM